MGPPKIYDVTELIYALIVYGPQKLPVVLDIESVYVAVATKSP